MARVNVKQLRSQRNLRPETGKRFRQLFWIGFLLDVRLTRPTSKRIARNSFNRHTIHIPYRHRPYSARALSLRIFRLTSGAKSPRALNTLIASRSLDVSV